MSYRQSAYNKKKMVPKFLNGGDPREDLTRGALQSGVETGLNMAMPGLGSAYGVTTQLGNALFTNNDGTYKNKASMYLNYWTNPVEFITDLSTGNLGNKREAKAAEDLKLTNSNRQIQQGKDNLTSAIGAGYSQAGYKNVAMRKYGGFVSEFNKAFPNTQKQTPAFEKRMGSKTIAPIKNKDGSISTHKMMSWGSDGIFYAAPTVVEINGKLKELTPDEAIAHAYKTKDFRTFETEQQATDYANNGYKKGVMEITKEGMKKYGGSLKKYGTGAKIQNPQYEVEGQEMVEGNDVNLENQEQVASDMHKAVGPSHENGGVKGVGGEKVYSDRMKVTSNALNTLKSMGFKPSKNKVTVAEAAEFVARKQKTYEDLSKSSRPSDVTTSRLMLERIEQAKDLLFQDQESQKENEMEGGKEYKEGGIIKYAYGSSSTSPFNNKSTRKMYKNYNNSNTLGEGETSINNENTTLEDTATGDTSMSNDSVDSSSENSSSKYAAAIGFGTNALNYASDLAQLSKVQTQIEPNLPTTNYKRYVDRSGSALNQIQTSLNTGVRGLRYSSSRGRNAAIAAMTGGSYDVINQIANTENSRRDSIEANNVDISNTASTLRANILQKTNEDNISRANELIATKMQAKNAMLDGTMKQLKEIRDTNYANDKNEADTNASKAELKLRMMQDPDLAARLAEQYGIDGKDIDAIADRWIEEQATFYSKGRRQYKR